MSTNTENPNNTIIPTACITASTLRLTGFFRIHSIAQNTTLLPSSAGIGNKLNTARFIPIKPAISSKYCSPPWRILSLVAVIVVIGPPTLSIPSLPVKSSPSVVNIVPPTLIEYPKPRPIVSTNVKRIVFVEYLTERSPVWKASNFLPATKMLQQI